MTETEFLVLRLYGPLAAWGDVAIGEVRPIRVHPTKSALIGLLGAALGIRRDQDDVISRMSESYGFAVADEGRKTRLRDFHTVQQAPANKEKIYGTGYHLNRQRELSIPSTDLETSLTYRDYICDVIYTVAIWVKKEDTLPFTLSEIRDALREPVFVPYLGRKSCVLSRPMEPQLILAGTPMDALKKAEFYGDTADYAYQGKLYIYRRNFNDTESKIMDDKTGQILYEGDWGASAVTEETVRDEPLSRTSWQFSNRIVKRAPFNRSVV